jgi:2-deoxystreptamine N-acetyl-D-glucosaminyltransferase/2-deoxystreptamine glucosyltransferase
VFSNRPLRERFLALLPPGLADRVHRRSAVVAMGVDPSALGPPVSRRSARRRLDVAGRFVVGFLGRCVPVKGLDLLVRALEGLPGAILAVAGEGPDLEGARRIAKRSGVDLRPLGRVEGHDRSAFFAACDVLALPSVVLPSGRTEGTPVVVLEALSQGLPVVASDVGGVSEVIRDGRTGYLVPPGDVPALAARLSALGRRPAVRRRMAKAAAIAGRCHHWDRVGPRLAELVLAP